MPVLVLWITAGLDGESRACPCVPARAVPKLLRAPGAWGWGPLVRPGGLFAFWLVFYVLTPSAQVTGVGEERER